jgi:hypothetical protein
MPLPDSQSGAFGQTQPRLLVGSSLPHVGVNGVGNQKGRLVDDDTSRA